MSSFERNQRHWQRTYFFAAGLIALFIPVGSFLGWPVAAFVWLFAWVASMVLGALVMRSSSRRLVLVTAYALAAFSGLAATTLVSMGGPGSAEFGLLLALPLGVMALVPSMPWAAVLVGVFTLTGGVVQLVNTQAPRDFVVMWTALSVALTGVALMGARGFRRVWVSEMKAERHRAQLAQQLVESEQRRARVERLALAGRLSGALGHELNNPLAVVLAGLGYLRAPGPPPDDHDEVLAEMQQAVEHMAQKVAAMRALDQDTAAPLEPLELGVVLGEALRRATKVKVERPPLEGLPRVLGVAPLLEGALGELLANADEAGAPVRVRVGVEVAHVVVDVEDDGPGLSPEVEAHLFEPFVTTRGPARSGLGLAVAREQVLRCGGTLEGATRPEGGARFTLRLQRAGAPES